MRKSTRTRIPSQRVLQRNESSSSSRIFRLDCEEIRVKWVLHGSVVWWNATVVRVDEPTADANGKYCSGEILYHRLDNYDREKAIVTFTVTDGIRSLFAVNEAGDRLEGDEFSPPWIFEDEPVPGDIDQDSASSTSSTDSNDAPTIPIVADESEVQGTNTPNRQLSKLSSLVKHSSVISKRRRNSNRSQAVQQADLPQPHTVPGKRTSAVQQKKFQSRRRSSKRNEFRVMNTGKSSIPSPVLEGVSNSQIAPYPQVNKQNVAQAVGTDERSKYLGVHHVDNSSSQSSTSVLNLGLRIHLLEAQLMQFISTSGSPPIPSSSLVILMGLRWSLMKRLERPLKEVLSDVVCNYGLSTSSFSVKCDCDHKAFRDISAFIAWTHGFNDNNSDPAPSHTTRIKFIPSIHRAVSKSLGTDNVCITFNVLSDILALLGVQDEDDFEQIICRESRGSNNHILQICGCLDTVDDDVRDKDESSHSSHSKVSVQTSSDTPTPFFRLFIGAVPHVVLAQKILGHDVETTAKDKLPCPDLHLRTFSSVLFEQPRENYSLDRNCYRAKWRARLVTTSFSAMKPASSSEPDKLRSFFFKWTRMKAPSLTKWSRDAQTLSLTVPGQLLLSVPVVNCSSQSNSLAISKLMDQHVETFMDQRMDIIKGYQSPNIRK